MYNNNEDELCDVSSDTETEISLPSHATSESQYTTLDGLFINVMWIVFELLTTFKDFYNVSVKPTFNFLTIGYFKTHVTVMYNGIDDVHTYSSLESFVHDQYFHEAYKFMILTDESENGVNNKYIIKNDGEDITSTIKYQDHKISSASILVLRATLPNSDEKYDINLKLPDNYMVVGNILNHYFVAWYLLNNYTISCDHSELLHTKIEFMNSSYSIETVTAPYEIKMAEKSVDIYEVENDDNESESTSECCTDIDSDAELETDISVEESYYDDEYVIDADMDCVNTPTFTFEQINMEEVISVNDDNKETPRSSVTRTTSDEEIHESEKEKNVNPNVHFSLNEKEEIPVRKPKIIEGNKNKSINQDTCTCGLCGDEYHITELNEFLLCQCCT